MRHMIKKYMSLPCRKGDGYLLPAAGRTYASRNQAKRTAEKRQAARETAWESELGLERAEVAVKARTKAGKDALDVLAEFSGHVHFVRNLETSLSMGYEKPEDYKRIGEALVVLGCAGYGEITKGRVQAAVDNVATLIAVAEQIHAHHIEFDRGSEIPSKSSSRG
jgi:hypothetical protein